MTADFSAATTFLNDNSFQDTDFNPSAVVDLTNNWIELPSAHGLNHGQEVTYSVAAGGTAIGGLTDGATYYAIVKDAKTFYLAESMFDAMAHTAGSPRNIDLTGFGITDDLSEPMKHVLSDVVVESEDFVVLYADGGDSSGGLGFKLGAGGESIGFDQVTEFQ